MIKEPGQYTLRIMCKTEPCPKFIATLRASNGMLKALPDMTYELTVGRLPVTLSGEVKLILGGRRAAPARTFSNEWSKQRVENALGSVPPNGPPPAAKPDEDCPPSCPASPAAFGRHGAPDPIRASDLKVVKPGTGPTNPGNPFPGGGPALAVGQGASGPATKACVGKVVTGKGGAQPVCDSSSAKQDLATKR